MVTASVTPATSSPPPAGAPAGTSVSRPTPIAHDRDRYQHERGAGDDRRDHPTQERKPRGHGELKQRRYDDETRQRRQPALRERDHRDRDEVGAGAGHENVAGADAAYAGRLQGRGDAADDERGGDRPREVQLTLARRPDDDGHHQDDVGDHEDDTLEGDAGRHQRRARLVRLVADVSVEAAHPGECMPTGAPGKCPARACSGQSTGDTPDTSPGYHARTDSDEDRTMIERRFRDLWERLQGKKPHLPHFLAEIHLEGIRGIDDVRSKFDYPVSVIAGGNASGKSTLLFAAACAYKVPGAGVKDFVPSTLFPDYRPKVGAREDQKPEIVIEFDYLTSDGRRSMRWRRAKGWNRSFLGRKNATQPERPVYLRTLSNLSNPSEVRGVLSMSRLRSAPRETPLTASQIAFAQQMLPFRYSEVVNLASGSKNLLFAAQEAGAVYSELHMAAGERAMLRLSREIAQLEGALVLIDEVEAGLHPWVQQLLMLQLQQLALRNEGRVRCSIAPRADPAGSPSE